MQNKRIDVDKDVDTNIDIDIDIYIYIYIYINEHENQKRVCRLVSTSSRPHGNKKFISTNQLVFMRLFSDVICCNT